MERQNSISVVQDRTRTISEDNITSNSINAVPRDYSEAFQRTKFELLFILDAIWSCTVIFPLIVMYWSGTWYLLDSYVFPDSPRLSTGVCLASGIFILFLMYYILPLLEGRIEVRWSLKHVLVSRIIIYVTALGIVLIFRGIWNYVDYLVNKRIEISWGILIFSQMSLIILKSSSSAAGSPMVIQTDITEDFYRVLPRSRTRINDLYYYTLDVLLSVLLIFTLIILLWASLWQIFDALVLPDDQFHSFLVCLGGGFVFTIILFSIQRTLERLLIQVAAPGARRLDYCLVYVADVAYGFVSTVVVLMLWRGLWGLVRTYLLVHSSQWRLGLSFHILGFFGMIVLQVGKTLGSVGCAVDREYLILAHLPSDADADDTRGLDVYATGIASRTEYFTLLYRRYLHSQRYHRVSTEEESGDEREENERSSLIRNSSESSSGNNV